MNIKREIGMAIPIGYDSGQPTGTLMIRNIGITAAVLGLTLIGVHWLLQGSNLMAFARHLPGHDSASMLEYYTGQVYFNAESYDTAGTYFKHVFHQFPSSPYAERAHVFWLECRGQRLTRSPAETVAECKAFLEQYPKSAFAPRVRRVEDVCERANLH
jgi:hypothetical protein